MRAAREIALVGLFTAVLLGGQFVLSMVAGVEVVTVLLAAFAYKFGVRRGLMVANAFILLRCFIYGFFPTVIILYLVYYNLFVLVFGLLGKKCGKGALPIVTVAAVIMTMLFTLLDDIICPLFYGFSRDAAISYFYASLPVMLTQCACTLLTTLILFNPLIKIYSSFNIK